MGRLCHSARHHTAESLHPTGDTMTDATGIEARRKRARELRAAGAPYRAIGAELGVSHTTARKYAPAPAGQPAETLPQPPLEPPGESPGRIRSARRRGGAVTTPTVYAPERESGGAIEGLAGRLVVWLEGLTLPCGSAFEVMPWEREFCELMADESGDLGLSIARGGGKTGFVSGIATAAVHPDGPLHRRRAETVLVAHDFKQSGVAFADVRDMLFRGGAPGRDWRLLDSSNARRIEHRPTGAAVECISSNPRRAHGLRPLLVLADEPSQWEPGTSARMLAALETSLGKVPGSRLIALGTRPEGADHWFERMLRDKPSLVYAADPEADPMDEAAWAEANPSLPWMPHLRERIAMEAAAIRGEPSALARFRALRLNAGVSDTAAAVLISAAAWARVERAAPPERKGRPVWGVDLGGSAASSAVAAVWETGRVECMAAFPRDPDLAERGRADNVGRRYLDLAARGELLTLGGRAMDYEALMAEARKRFGLPGVVVADRWRQAELADSLAAAGVPSRHFVGRGQGWKDGGQDVRLFERAVLEERIGVLPSQLARDALAEARTATDAAGNRKITKGSGGGRRSRARDDTAVALTLAVAEYMRREPWRPKRRTWRYAGTV